jgi:hypothetical protein
VSRDKVVGNQCVVGMVAILLYFFGNDRGSLVCEQAEPGEPRFFGSVGSEGL